MPRLDLPSNFTEELAALVRGKDEAWLEAVLIDQKNRWIEGVGVPAEAYRDALPALQSDAKAWRALIEGEYQIRVDLSEGLTPEDYLQRFPSHEDLLPQLEAYRALMSGATWFPTPLPAHGDLDTNQPATDDGHATASQLYPSRLGGFRIHKQLGAGGMALVLQAYDPRISRDVALKVIKPELLASARARERFLREARNMGRVANDHVVTIFQSGEVDGLPFLVMELLKGEPLNERLARKGRLLWAEAVWIGLETAVGLEALHQCGIIHRDIKPSNIWLQDRSREAGAGRRERVKILDFGIARTVELDDHITKDFVGTVAYASPEQVALEKVDKQTDLFSLGTVLYQMVTGRLPFQGPTKKAVLQQVRTHTPPPARELVSDIPDALSRLIEQLLDKDRTRRPTSAEEVLLTLSCLVEPAFPSALAGEVADRNLGKLIAAWPTLSPPIRRAIWALVESAGY